jgi:8-oxo-dGTP diphosphatase
MIGQLSLVHTNAILSGKRLFRASLTIFITPRQAYLIPWISNMLIGLHSSLSGRVCIMAAMPATDQGLQTERYQLIPRVLVFITSPKGLLLIKGAPTKRVWPNKYNGIGGHVEAGENILTAAVREVKEETGLTLTTLNLRAIITVDTGQPVGICLFIFRGEADAVETVAGPEGALQWVPLDEVGQLDLVEDLHILIPKVLTSDVSAGPLIGRYSYGADGNLIVQLTG